LYFRDWLDSLLLSTVQRTSESLVPHVVCNQQHFRLAGNMHLTGPAKLWAASGQKRMGDAFLVVSLVVFLEDERIESVSPKSFFFGCSLLPAQILTV